MDDKKTITVDSHGVKVAVDPARFDDVRVAMAIVTITDDCATDGERLTATRDFYRVIFGGGFRRVMDDLAKANGGRISNADFGEFARDVIGAAKAKN